MKRFRFKMETFWVRLRLCFFILFRMPHERIGQRIRNRMSNTANVTTLYYMTDKHLLLTLQKELK